VSYKILTKRTRLTKKDRKKKQQKLANDFTRIIVTS